MSLYTVNYPAERFKQSEEMVNVYHEWTRVQCPHPNLSVFGDTWNQCVGGVRSFRRDGMETSYEFCNYSLSAYY